VSGGVTAAPGARLPVRVNRSDVKCCPLAHVIMKEEGSTVPRQRCRPADESRLNDWSTRYQTINDHDYRDHQENVNQPATHVHDEEAEHP